MSLKSLLLLLLLLATTARSQDLNTPSFYFGPTIGLEGGLQSTYLPVYAGSPDCGVFTIGNGISPSFGLTLLFPRLFSGRLGFSITSGGTYYTGGFARLPVDPVRIVDETSNQIVQLDRDFRLKWSEYGLFTDILARYRLSDHWSIAAGGAFGYRVGSSHEQTDNVYGPGDYRFPDGQSAHVMTNGTPLTLSGFDVGASAQLLYDIPLARNTILQPGATFHASFASSVEEAGWQKYNVGAKLSLLFAIPPSPPVEIPMPPPPVLIHPRLAATVEMVGLDLAHKPTPLGKVRVNEVVYRQIAPLLPAVFFEKETSVLPDRYKLLDRAGTDTFSIDHLAGTTVYETQHHTLDIIGARMRKHPNAKVFLSGSVSRDEASKYARPRAEWVRDYFINVWNIPASRVQIRDGGNFMERSNELSDDGRADNRRVEIASNVAEVMAPVATEQIVRDFNPAAVQVNPVIEAEAGVKGWSLKILQGGNEVATYAGGDRESLNSPAMTWTLADKKIDSALAPLDAILEVEDSVGNHVMARDRVELQLVRRVRFVDGRIERLGNHERIAYTLVGFEFDRPELGVQNEGFIRDMAELTRRGATIKIEGYTDRIGDTVRNNQLSIERASRVETALRRALATRGIRDAAITTVGLGIETARYTNEVAEGRVLSRGVNVVVEQDVVDEDTR